MKLDYADAVAYAIRLEGYVRMVHEAATSECAALAALSPAPTERKKRFETLANEYGVALSRATQLKSALLEGGDPWTSNF